MAWIDTVPFEEADGVLAMLYEQQAAVLGRPTELTMLGSLYPDLTKIRSELYRVVEACPSSLSPLERQGVALAATGALGSEFLTSGVKAKFIAEGGDNSTAADLIAGRVSALSPGAAALARYARLVATHPADAEETDVAACRDAGASDLDILDANSLAAYYAYLARVCLGLGLREPYEPT